MSIKIVNDRIEGTRITVFDVYYYQLHGRSGVEIADILSITPEELQAAEQYIQEPRADTLLKRLRPFVVSVSGDEY